MQNDTIVANVSKDHLDAYRLRDGVSRRFANDRSGHKAFVKWLAHGSVQRVVFEPTGPYHRAFERALGAAGVPFVKVNPRQARRFADAIGRRPRPTAWMRRCWRLWAQCWSCRRGRLGAKPCLTSRSFT